MKRLFILCLVLIGSAQISNVFAQTKKRERCVEERVSALPMATLGNIPANAILVGKIEAGPTVYCEKETPAPAQAPAPAREQPVKAAKPARAKVEPKR